MAPFANLLHSSARSAAPPTQHDDDSTDHVGSNPSTPSGIATPQPDLQDKRLPGIMHSYFGQVGNESSTPSAIQASSPSASASKASHVPSAQDGSLQTPTVELSTPEMNSHRSDGRLSRSSSASGSIVMVEKGDHLEHEPPLLSHEALSKSSHEASSQRLDPELPTPPSSSSPCSLLGKPSRGASPSPSVDQGMGSICRALKNFITSSSPQTTATTHTRERHHSLPLSGLSTVPVLASDFSNPTTSTPPSSATPVEQDGFDFVSREDKDEKTTPTQDAGSTSEKTKEESADNTTVAKNTPPLTPRALSQEGHPNGAASRSGSTGQSEKAAAAAKPSNGLNMGAVNGKLHVKISQGRGLRPSYDPYVVCVFEWNEYISKGPKSEEQNKEKKESLQSVPIRRTDSDMGRPMAIPMKSRQSSQNSATDEPKNTALVTNPEWDHEAVL